MKYIILAFRQQRAEGLFVSCHDKRRAREAIRKPILFGELSTPQVPSNVTLNEAIIPAKILSCDGDYDRFAGTVTIMHYGGGLVNVCVLINHFEQCWLYLDDFRRQVLEPVFSTFCNSLKDTTVAFDHNVELCAHP